jgi:hypothetical protein
MAFAEALKAVLIELMHNLSTVIRRLDRRIQ